MQRFVSAWEAHMPGRQSPLRGPSAAQHPHSTAAAVPQGCARGLRRLAPAAAPAAYQPEDDSLQRGPRDGQHLQVSSTHVTRPHSTAEPCPVRLRCGAWGSRLRNPAACAVSEE
jgi:hypothetical protein